MLDEIFQNVICYEEDVILMGKQLDEEISDFLKPYQDKFTNREMEIIKNILYQTELSAKQMGFRLGVKYTLRLIKEL